MKALALHIYLYIFVTLLIINEGIYLALGFFSVDELKPAKYEIDILQTPVKLKEERNSPVMYMTSKYGQQYQCLLPQQELVQPNAENRDVPSDGNVDVKELLQPLQSAQCLLKTMDWWTYEFCFSHFIKQYHVEDGKIVGSVITLGLYDSDYDWSNETNKEKISSQVKRYHSQLYINGTKCDLTNLPRNAEVRFYCEEDAGDYIYRVDEPGTCSYILTVHTSRICSHPLLKPVPSNKPHVISCSPLLSEEQYQQYLDKVEEEKKVAEEKRKEWLAEQQERLKKLKGWAQEQWQKFEKDVKSEEADSEEVTIADDNLEEETSRKDSMNLKSDITSDDLEKKDSSNTNLVAEKTSDTAESIEDGELLKEFEKELGDMSPEQRTKLATYKDDLHHQISQQFNAILNEAEEELQQELNDETKDAAFSKLASTLNMLLEKLDKAEKDVAMATKELEKAKSVIVNKKSMKSNSVNDHEGNKQSDILTDDEEEEEEEEEEDELLADSDEQDDEISTSEDDETLKEKQNQKPAAVLDDGKVHVRIRRLGRRSRNLDGKLQELDISQRQKLEQAVKEKLEKAGLDTGGRRIEVKIITAGYYDNEDGKDFHALSDEETQQFQTMIMTLLTGNQEAIQEMERHKKLEKNYNFVWGKDNLEKDEEE